MYYAPYSRLPKHASSAKQSIIITGLGAKEFDVYMLAILELHVKLASVLLPNSLQDWKPILDRICLKLTSRYFAMEMDHGGHELLHIPASLDPLGVLT